jgi:hypothetical protein
LRVGLDLVHDHRPFGGSGGDVYGDGGRGGGVAVGVVGADGEGVDVLLGGDGVEGGGGEAGGDGVEGAGGGGGGEDGVAFGVCGGMPGKGESVGSGGGGQGGWSGRGWARREEAVDAELAGAGVAVAEAGEEDFAVGDGGRGHLGVVAAVVAGAELPGVPELVLDVVGEVGVEDAGAGLVPGVAGGVDCGPEDALLAAVGREGEHGAGVAFVGLGADGDGGGVDGAGDVNFVDAGLIALAPDVEEVGRGGVAVPEDEAVEVGAGRGEVLEGVLVAEVAEVGGVEGIEDAFFATADDAVGVGDEGCAGGVEVVVVFVELEVVGGGEPVEEVEVGVELEEGLAEVGDAVPGAVAGDDVDVAGGVDGGGLAGVPDAGAGAGGRGVEDGGLVEGGGVVGEEEAMVRLFVAVGGVADVDGAVGEREGGALVLHEGVEGGGGDGDGAVVEVGTGGEVEGVEALLEVGAGVGEGDDVEGVAGAVDDGGADDAHVAVDVGAVEGGVVEVGGGAEVDVPDGSCAGVIGVEGVDAVVDGGDEDEVVGSAVDLDVGGEEGLGVELIVEGELVEEAEVGGVDVGGGEDGLVGIGAGAGVVVVLGEDVGLDLGLGEEKGGEGEQEGCGGDAACVREVQRGQGVAFSGCDSVLRCTRVKWAV